MSVSCLYKVTFTASYFSLSQLSLPQLSLKSGGRGKELAGLSLQLTIYNYNSQISTNMTALFCLMGIITWMHKKHFWLGLLYVPEYFQGVARQPAETKITLYTCFTHILQFKIALFECTKYDSLHKTQQSISSTMG